MNNLDNQEINLDKSIFNLKDIDNVNKTELNNTANNCEDNTANNCEDNMANNNEDNTANNCEDNMANNNEDNMANNNEDNTANNNEDNTANNASNSESESEYGTTETSCSINSEDCLEYDSDISSNDSVFFYSESDDFVDNRFVRINHKPFLKLMKDKEQQIKEDDDDNTFECPSSMSRILDKSIFEEINKINEKIEQEYEKIKVIFSDKKQNIEKNTTESNLNNNSEDVVC